MPMMPRSEHEHTRGKRAATRLAPRRQARQSLLSRSTFSVSTRTTGFTGTESRPKSAAGSILPFGRSSVR
jgi:hypothetical protein